MDNVRVNNIGILSPLLMLSYCSPVQKDFVRIVRGVEFLLGIGLPRPSRIRRQQNNFTAIMHDSAFANDELAFHSDGVRQALLKSSSILDELTTEMDIGQLDDVSYLRFQSRKPFMTSYVSFRAVKLYF